MSFHTRRRNAEPDAIAPDGSEVRVLGGSVRGSMAEFTLPPGVVSKPVAHHTVEEVWVFISGTGRLWRRIGDVEEVTAVHPGVSIAIPAGMAFQFRCDGHEPLVAIGVTMPPWPGNHEAYAVDGKW